MSYDTPQVYRFREPGAPPQMPALAVYFVEEAMINHEVTRTLGVQSYDNVLVAYVGPMGIGEPPSWEKAAMYVVMCLVLITSGGGLFSLDNLVIADLIRSLL